MSITIISNHQPAHRLPEIAESLPWPILTISDRNATKPFFALSNAKQVVAHGVEAA
jgi:hypothetical protein